MEYDQYFEGRDCGSFRGKGCYPAVWRRAMSVLLSRTLPDHGQVSPSRKTGPSFGGNGSSRSTALQGPLTGYRGQIVGDQMDQTLGIPQPDPEEMEGEFCIGSKTS